MTLTAQQITDNWKTFKGYIETHISEPRKTNLLAFYKKFEDRLVIMPASTKRAYHNAVPGGYIDHVNRVIEGSLRIMETWKGMGADINFTTEELVFSAINHDLGKMGDSENELMVPQTDSWRKKNLGEEYTFNSDVQFASVPDRSLFLLQEHGIKYNFNEMLAIQTHDGLYDEANKKYLMTWLPETKFRSSLPYILHQGDMMAARIEFEREYKDEFKSSTPPPKLKPTVTKSTATKALGTIKSNKLHNLLKDI